MLQFRGLSSAGIAAAMGAAVLFGAGTPLAKLLLAAVNPWMLAGLLYLGSGLGLALYRLIGCCAPVHLPAGEGRWLLAAIVSGGVAGPVLLMIGLTQTAAAEASLLLNAESVFTALLAWFVFKENFDRRIAIGMLAIMAGALLLSWPGVWRFDSLWPSLAILGACLCWGLDNNFTRKVSLTDATWLASVKGLAAGSVNLLLGLLIGAQFPAVSIVLAALVLGFLAYGVSLTLFVLGLRHLGTARTGAYFGVAPFFGAVLAVLLGEPVTLPLLLAGLLMALGIWLHLSERHEHDHEHQALEHEHPHEHDEHHQHDHDYPIEAGTVHTHRHQHLPLRHRHVHYPDAHHVHKH